MVQIPPAVPIFLALAGPLGEICFRLRDQALHIANTLFCRLFFDTAAIRHLAPSADVLVLMSVTWRGIIDGRPRARLGLR